MSFNQSMNSDYEVISENEAASIICYFTPEMISDLVEKTLQNKYTNYNDTMPNTIFALETYFKQSAAQLPEYANDLTLKRNETYLNIILQICKYHDLSYTRATAEYTDIYSDAAHLFDFLVSRFNQNIVNFFTNYIIREQSTLYEALDLASKKKDLSGYSKKIYKTGSKIAIIHSNLEYVIENICAYDIDLETYIDFAYIDKQLASYIKSLLVDNGDFFKRYIVPYVNIYGPIIITNIKFALQGFADYKF